MERIATFIDLRDSQFQEMSGLLLSRRIHGNSRRNSDGTAFIEFNSFRTTYTWETINTQIWSEFQSALISELPIVQEWMIFCYFAASSTAIFASKYTVIEPVILDSLPLFCFKFVYLRLERLDISVGKFHQLADYSKHRFFRSNKYLLLFSKKQKKPIIYAAR